MRVMTMTWLCWWTRKPINAWPMKVVFRAVQGIEVLLAYEVPVDELEERWDAIRLWDESARRLGPSVKQYRCVVVESPFKGGGEKYARYLQRCLADCVKRGESPYASHKMLPGVLDDDVQEQRALGICLGFAWRRNAYLTAVYTDYGISDGMKDGIEDATAIGQVVDYREIGAE